MSVVGRFEILSPVFSGTVDTSTARDPQTGETVLLHLLPPGHEDSPREFFLELAPGCPGEILDHGVDSETKRAFVITDYPKDRKAVRLWIREMIGIGAPAKPAKSVTGRLRSPVAGPPPGAPAPPAVKEAAQFTDPFAAFTAQAAPAKPAAMPSDSATRMFDPTAVFGAAAAPAASPAAKEQAKPNAPQEGATRMFDPTAVFGGAAAPKPAAAAPKPASDGATRMFDPSSVFGGPAAAPAKASSAPDPQQDGATRMFDPSSVFGSSAPAKPPAPTAPEGATRLLDPSAIFSAPAEKPKTPAKEHVPDSSKRAADDFIHGRLPAEFRDAPIKVQRSLEELLGAKAKGPVVEPTPGRPGVITLLFDAYGKRIENAEHPSDAPTEDSAAASNSGATRMISSADLSTFFSGGASPDQDEKEKGPNPPRQDSPRNRK